MNTINQDVTKIKSLLSQKNNAEVKKLSDLFIPEYNMKILSKLNPIERVEWLKINNY
jgi:hypothetical protein